MWNLIYCKEDEEVVKKEILPVFEGQKVELLAVESKDEWTSIRKEESVICYLPDSALKEVLLSAGNKEWKLGILPHPKMQYALEALSIKPSLEATLDEILENKIQQKCDLFYCNEELIFKSVRMGNFALIDSVEGHKSPWSQVVSIFKTIWNLRNARHQQVKVTVGEDFNLNTSALGVIAVDHAKRSIMTSSFSGSSLRFQNKDGKLHLLIVSPESLLEMWRFLIMSLFSFALKKPGRPKFIGYIRCDEIEIREIGKNGFVIDGQKQQAEELKLSVHQGAIQLLQKSSVETTKEESPDTSNQFKVEGLPQGEKRDALIRKPITLLPRASTEDFKDLFTVLRNNSKLTTPYLVMMTIASIIATFGLYHNSTPVIIGAMILTPLMSPIVAFSMAIIRFDVSMITSSMRTILMGTGVSILFAALVSLMIPMRIITPEIDVRLTPNLLDLGIAVASGVAGAYAHAKEEIAKTLAGVAIAVALIPPLAVAGIGIGWMDWTVFSGALLLYLTNLAGIVLFGGVTFILLGFAPFKQAKKGLIASLIVTSILAIPLAFSFNHIMNEAAITRSLEGLIISELTIRDVKVRRGEEKTIVSLRLLAEESISDEQIRELKKKIEERINQPIKLEVSTNLEF